MTQLPKSYKEHLIAAHSLLEDAHDVDNGYDTNSRTLVAMLAVAHAAIAAAQAVGTRDFNRTPFSSDDYW